MKILIEIGKWILLPITLPIVIFIGIPIMLYAFFTRLAGVDGHG